MSHRGRLTFSDVLKIMELRTKIVSVSSFLIGTAYAWAAGGRPLWLRVVLMGVATLCIDFATASFNSYHDFKRGVDRVDTDVARYKVLAHRDIDPRIALWLGWAMFAVAAPLGLALGFLVGWEVVAAGAVCMAVSYFYSGGPYPLAATPVGEVFAGGMLGSVLVALSVYVQLESVPAAAWWLGVPSTLIIAAILAMNNACDRVGDARAGRRTLAILVGPAGARRFVHVLLAAGYAAAFALIPAGVLAARECLPLAAGLFIAGREMSRLRGRPLSHETKPAAMAAISRAFLAYTAAMLIAVSLGT